MASAEQIKALLKSHVDGDDAHFYAVAMQVAAHEAKLGHSRIANELRAFIDEAKLRQPLKNARRTVPIAQPRGELSSLLSVSYPKLRLSDMILVESVSDRLVRIIKEHRQIAKIRSYGLAPRKKLLLVGPPGTGKTMSAAVLAGELGIPLFVVRLDSLITKFMGETASKLRLIFEAITQSRGVYLFDEFDSIGSQRGLSNDVGEIRRVLNSFLQLIEQDDSDSLLLAATNHPEILDYALFRRFDDVVEYVLPEQEQLISALQAKLAVFQKSKIDWKKLADAATGLSYADITRACEEAIKEAIIHDRQKVATGDVLKNLSERKSIRSK
ncbi:MULTISPECIES: AAA family ATPase [Geobacter]|uniref:AAA family ATPase n=1 Tax=Geobacter TaxID=28231 RepID=UPI002573B00F|nr:ATP-binding protein [Geobacter sulfurreducens]BEH09876.1 ATP-binding protein [Geobacter sulfurreducens subsp. ethanolicus]